MERPAVGQEIPSLMLLDFCIGLWGLRPIIGSRVRGQKHRGLFSLADPLLSHLRLTFIVSLQDFNDRGVQGPRRHGRTKWVWVTVLWGVHYIHSPAPGQCPGSPCQPRSLWSEGLPLLTCSFWTGRTVIVSFEYSCGPTITSFTWCWLLPSALLFFFFCIPF